MYNGQRVRVSGVSPALVDQVQAAVKDPDVPMAVLDDGSEVENPTHPAYIRALEEAEATRQRRSLHAIILFGLTLIDEDGEDMDPPEDGWERKLRRVGLDWRKEILELMGAEEFFDDEDEALARRDAYLLFIAFSGHPDDVKMVRELAGADQLAQQQAEAGF